MPHIPSLLWQRLYSLGRPLACLTIGALASLAVANALPPEFAKYKAATLTSLESDLEANFQNPDEEAKPWTFWYWMSRNVTREGITYDLEAMARAGIGGAYIFAIDRPGYADEFTKVEHPVMPDSELFWDMVEHAVKEAERLGMRIALNACDGWSLAGGPWNAPENSMQKIVSSTVVVNGGKDTKIQLPRPDTKVHGKSWVLPQYADYYQDMVVLAYPAAPGWGNISSTNLKGAQLVGNADTKVGMKLSRFTATRLPEWSTDTKVGADKVVAMDQIIDLTDKMDQQGNLNWTPPPGKWVIQRYGYTTTGETNRPTSEAGMGLEVDKFSREAAEFHFNHWWGKAAKRMGALSGKTFMMNHTDSWECGPQNWSPVFREEFIKRRGYDPIKYLPVTMGIPIGSAEESERFLWDFRRTVVDLISDGFFNKSVELSNKAGGLYSSETVTGILTDALEFFREVDVPMGEFWVATHGQGAPIMPRVSSGAHIYGKRFVQTESFTERGIQWTEDPYYLKTLGDYSYASGANRFALHVWAHQAFPEKVPGVTLFRVYGTVFSGNQPWHDLARPWFDYMTRTQALLQQGIPFADAAYFIGEELPTDAFQRQDLRPGLPFGYDFDSINRDALLTRTSAKDGRIVLPDGVSYAVLVLPQDGSRMTPEVAKKIGELASAGVTVIGPKPSKSYSLVNYPKADTEVQQIVAKSWGNVKNGIQTTDALQAKGLLPDVEFIGVDMSWVHRGKKVQKNHEKWNGENDTTKHKPEMGVEYSSPPFASIHRRTTDADLYFLTNQELEPQEVEVALRVTGKQPELWHPETGEMRPLTDWYVKDGRTHIPLKFDEAEAYFIVFRDAAQPPAKRTANFGDIKTLAKVEGPWTVSFQENRGAPAKVELPELASLSDHSEDGVKYFSGVATYSRPVTVEKGALKAGKGERVYLDLGEVAGVAEVTFNGKKLPSTWKPPYRVDVTDVVKDGENTLEVRVGGTWKNRLIGDARAPEDQRVTWAVYRDTWFNPKTKLDPSGLIGPVTFVKETPGAAVKAK